MIAQKPVDSQGYEMQDISKAESRVEEQLFAGLSFPEVPKTKIIIRNDLITSPPISKPSLLDLEAQFDDVNETSRLLSFPPEVVPSLPSSQMASTTGRKEEAEVKQKPVNLSMLYIPLEVLTNPKDSYSYPELPHIDRRPVSFASQSITRTGPPSSSSKASVASTHSTLHHSAQQPQSSTSAAESTLVNELLQENSRLASEVAALRRQLSSSASPPSLTTPQQSAALQSTPINSQQGVQINNPGTEAPAAGVKYVCCGSCRQWLRAHRDAIFVVCTNCEAVNNCSLVPVTGRTSAQEEAERQALQQQNSSDPFAFMDCITKTFF